MIKNCEHGELKTIVEAGKFTTMNEGIHCSTEIVAQAPFFIPEEDNFTVEAIIHAITVAVGIKIETNIITMAKTLKTIAIETVEEPKL